MGHQTAWDITWQKASTIIGGNRYELNEAIRPADWMALPRRTRQLWTKRQWVELQPRLPGRPKRNGDS